MLQIIIDLGKVHLLNDATVRIYGYGLMLVLGFLSGVYLGRWRARRMGEDPDVVVGIGMLALLGGVLGARLAYVIEQWSTQFSHESLWSILDITSGGLIYYGGLGLGMAVVLVYLLLKRLPVRRYLDIIAPSMMVGLGFGRLGCLLNGCCFGGVCDSNFALAAHFPMFSQPLVKLDGSKGPFSQGTQEASPAYASQFRTGLVHPDERLVSQFGAVRVLHLPRDLHGALSNDQLAVLTGTKDAAQAMFEKAAPDGEMDYAQWRAAWEKGDGFLRGSEFWDEAVEFSAAWPVDGQRVLNFEGAWRYLQARLAMLVARFDRNGDGKLTGKEYAAANSYLQADLIEMASHEHAVAILPSQALGAINAFLLALLLWMFIRLRNREGQAFALMMVLYPITRFVEELIRADNPHNLSKLLLTHNQYTSLAMFVVGIVLLAMLQRAPASAGPAWAARLAGRDASASKSVTTKGKKS